MKMLVIASASVLALSAGAVFAQSSNTSNLIRKRDRKYCHDQPDSSIPAPPTARMSIRASTATETRQPTAPSAYPRSAVLPRI